MKVKVIGTEKIEDIFNLQLNTIIIYKWIDIFTNSWSHSVTIFLEEPC